MNKNTVFIVEDDLISAQYLKETLEMEGYTILGIADNAPEAIEQLHDCEADIVLMDIILQGAMSGSEAAVILKHRHPECKILFLTAYADEEMIEYALDAQAVGYLMKPYREKEILATIRMALNRPEHHPADPSTSVQIHLSHHFVYDTRKDQLTREGRTIILSEKKRTLIRTLARSRNSVVSNEQLCLEIWGEPGHDSNLRSLISRLKSTLGAELITNANGLGYMITG